MITAFAILHAAIASLASWATFGELRLYRHTALGVFLACLYGAIAAVAGVTAALLFGL